MAGQAGGSSPHLNTDSKASLKQELLEKGCFFLLSGHPIIAPFRHATLSDTNASF